MSVQLESLPELNRRAFSILCRELGPAQAVRVFRQMGWGAGNYTEERRAVFANWTMEQVEQKLAELNAANASHYP
jgi:hypothetical protein